MLALSGLGGWIAVRLHAMEALGAAFGVVLFGAFGYWVRPHLVGLVAGQGKTLVWLSW